AALNIDTDSLSQFCDIQNNLIPEPNSTILYNTNDTVELPDSHDTPMPCGIELDLRNLGLTVLPPELFDIPNLVVLDLAYNNLSELPPEIIQLQNLRVLKVYNNYSLFFPCEVADLPEL